MSCTACSAGTSSSNSTTICETLSRLVERSALMPLSVLIASSIGSATLLSIVSGSAPGYDDGDRDDRELDVGEQIDADARVAEQPEHEQRRDQHHGEHRPFDR